MDTVKGGRVLQLVRYLQTVLESLHINGALVQQLNDAAARNVIRIAFGTTAAGVTVPWVPPLPVASWSERRSVPEHERIDGIDVYHPRYLVVPKTARPVHG